MAQPNFATLKPVQAPAPAGSQTSSQPNFSNLHPINQSGTVDFGQTSKSLSTSKAGVSHSTGLINSISTMLSPMANPNMVVGGVKEAAKIPYQISQLGSAGMNALSNVPGLGFLKNTPVQTPQALEAQGGMQKAGADITAVGEGLVPIGEEATGKAVDTAAETAMKYGKQAVLGSDAIKTLGQIGNEEAQKFVPSEYGGAGKTFDDVVDTVQKSINKFTTESKSALQAVKQAIPKIAVSPSYISEKVNQGIMSAVESNAAYKGVGEDAVSMFKNPKELINSGLLDDGEAKKVKGMVDVVSNWKDNTARGVLNLKEQLGSFYKDGMDNSNKILSNIQSGLKDIVGEAYPPIKDALATASSNIDQADNFQRNLIGKDTISGEAKLKTIANGIKNPAVNAGKINLISDLEKATGSQILPQLKGYADYAELLKKGFPTKTATVLGSAAQRLGIVGGLGAVTGWIKDHF